MHGLHGIAIEDNGAVNVGDGGLRNAAFAMEEGAAAAFALRRRQTLAPPEPGKDGAGQDDAAERGPFTGFQLWKAFW